MHIFPILERSSGNEALDQAALRYLARARFSSEDPGNEPAWGTATFLWGTDVKRHIKP
jgi:TonB family protein